MQVSGKKPGIRLPSTIAHGSENDLHLFCTPCDKEGPRLPAFGFCTDCKEHLCKDCFQHHTKPTPCRNHVLLDKHSMPKTQQTSLVTSKKQIKPVHDLTKPCNTHKNRVIEYYCVDHCKLLCNVCVTLYHNPSTCTVKYIPDISGAAIGSTELEVIMKQMNTIMKECQTVRSACKDRTRESDNSLSLALKDIKKYRNDMNKRLDELEYIVESQVKCLQNENVQRLLTTEAVCEDVRKSLAELMDDIKQTNRLKQADKLFIDMKTAQEEIYSYNGIVKDLADMKDVKTYKFTPNTSLMNNVKVQKSFGFLESKAHSTQMRVQKKMNERNYLSKSNENLSQKEKQKTVKAKLSLTSYTQQRQHNTGNYHVHDGYQSS